MNKENLSILTVRPRDYTHRYHEEKKMQPIAEVKVVYNDLMIVCALIRGKKLSNKEDPYFFFLEVPCRFFLTKEAEWKKFNMINFTDQETSDKFQSFCMQLLREHSPDLFVIKPESQEAKDEQSTKS